MCGVGCAGRVLGVSSRLEVCVSGSCYGVLAGQCWWAIRRGWFAGVRVRGWGSWVSACCGSSRSLAARLDVLLFCVCCLCVFFVVFFVVCVFCCVVVVVLLFVRFFVFVFFGGPPPDRPSAHGAPLEGSPPAHGSARPPLGPTVCFC